jgi:putative hydrolase of the HAD superfamily
VDATCSISAVVFDVDGVLVDVRFPRILRQSLGISQPDAAEFFEGPFERCLIGASELRHELPPFLEKWRWPGSFEEFLNFWFDEESQLNEPVLTAVDRLRSRGLRCFLASTQESRRAGFLEQRLAVGTRFEKAFFSCRLGCRKPDPAFFLTVMPEIGLQPAEILLLDDDHANVESAIGVGWHATQFRIGDDIHALLHAHGISSEG